MVGHTRRYQYFFIPAFLLLLLLALPGAAPASGSGDPLPGWRDGPAKKAIIDFVDRVTKKGGPDYVPPAERIAVFDNDGTLWAEQPFYFQLAFVLDRVKALAGKHPEWKNKEPFATALSGDRARLDRLNHDDFIKLLTATHTGMTSQEFQATVRAWLQKARHPQTGLPYTGMVYQPMLELLRYLAKNGFINFIVTGGGIDFVRAFAEKVYGVPPERVVGTSLKGKWQIKDGKPVIIKLPQLASFNDKEAKPLNINLHIGRRPILAAGNSDGDLAMLQWTAAGQGARLMLLVHHDDAAREYAYDRDSSIGRLDKAWDEAKRRGWSVISMRNDFARIYPGAGK